MILHPSIIALVAGSLMAGAMLLYASAYGVQIMRRWDLRSGSELQLVLERKTYLISTLITYSFAFQLLSLFLFVYTADNLAPLFVGAMCAAGALLVNGGGYPALVLKIVNFLLAGVWLIVNHADNTADDYPLIRKKYALLLVITPFVLAEAVVQAAYFFRLEPDVITSCCGSLFSHESGGFASSIASIPAKPMRAIFAAALALALATGLYRYRTGKGSYLFAAMSSAALIVSIAALISYISPYIYALPTHHCPFCILQREYGYVGYPIYFTLLGGAIAGMGVGVLEPFRTAPSLARRLPRIQKRLALLAVILYGLFAAIVVYRIVFSELKLGG